MIVQTRRGCISLPTVLEGLEVVAEIPQDIRPSRTVERICLHWAHACRGYERKNVAHRQSQSGDECGEELGFKAGRPGHILDYQSRIFV